MSTRPVLDGLRLAAPSGDPDCPLLVVGPSLGTSAALLWNIAAQHLSPYVRVLSWDLPGHGSAQGACPDPFVMADLAGAVLGLVDRMSPGGVFHYAGVSVGGCVGLQLLLDAPERVATASLICTGARIGTPQAWHERAATVRRSGTRAVRDSSAQRWFATGFDERDPATYRALIDGLDDIEPEGYARVCEALADFDVQTRLTQITAPVCTIAGSEDIATPPQLSHQIAVGVQSGRNVVLDGVAHLAPAEKPREVAEVIMSHIARHADTASSRADS